MPNFIQIEDLSYNYILNDGKTISALKGINLTVEKGEFVAIVGANGSGKTTLARHLNGLLLPTKGTVRINGLDTKNQANIPEIRQQIGMVFQFPEDQIIASVVEDDIAFGPENLGLGPKEIQSRVNDALGAVDLLDHRKREPHQLSSGQMQRLALAGVLAMHPECIVLDEATIMLDPKGRKKIWGIIQQLHEIGMTIIVITHDMQEAAQADRIIILHDGEIALEGAPSRIFSNAGNLFAYGLTNPPINDVIRQLRRIISDIDPGIFTLEQLVCQIPDWNSLMSASAFNPVQTDDFDRAQLPIVQVDHLGHTYMLGTPFAYPALVDINLKVWKGRSHGLAGRTGSGKSTLLQHINGLLIPQSGSVLASGFDLKSKGWNRKQIASQIGLVMQNPEMQFFEKYVGDEIAFGPRQTGFKGSLVDTVRWAMEIVGLNFEQFKDRTVQTLSGGEKRKTALASALASRPSLLLLDEPTAGLDPLSHQEILRNLNRLQKIGMTLIISSHQMDDLAALTPDLSILEKGVNIQTGPTRDLFYDSWINSGSNLEPPLIVQIVKILMNKGWPVPQGILTLPEMERWIDSVVEVVG